MKVKYLRGQEYMGSKGEPMRKVRTRFKSQWDITKGVGGEPIVQPLQKTHKRGFEKGRLVRKTNKSRKGSQVALDSRY